MLKTPEAALKDAYELQEEITRLKKVIREKDAVYKSIMDDLEAENVSRAGDYGRKKKVTLRRSVISDKFRENWPEVFYRLAKVSLKDAEGVLTPDALEDVCTVSESISWKIQFYGQGKGGV